MKHQTKEKPETHEERIERFKTKYIRTYGSNNYFRSTCVYDIYKQLVQQTYQLVDTYQLVPVFISPTFNKIPEGEKGCSMVNKTIEKFRQNTLLPTLVCRHYARHPEQRVTILCVPEFGRGKSGSGPWHLHGFLFCTTEARRKIFTSNNMEILNDRFRSMSDYNQEFHIERTDADDIPRMVSYMLKKAAGLPDFLSEEIPMVWG